MNNTSQTAFRTLVPERAFSTDSAADILRFAMDCLDGGAGVALATLIEIRGGSARALGAHMAIRDDGRYCGFVSGGCVEAAVASEAVDAIGEGADRHVLFGEGSPFFDIVLPCGGGITIAIHVLRHSAPIRTVLDGLENRSPAGLRYEPSKQALTAIEAPKRAGWQFENFVTVYRPRARVFLSGRSIEVDTTARIAEAAGYEVYRHDNANLEPDASRIDADTAVALLHHDIDLEIPVLQAALGAEPFYLGALGSARTHARRMERLRDIGYSEADLARIKSPIGIFNRARDAQSLALSVLADLAATRVARFG
ncbi:XdhC family protein [Agrobacterium vitis]|uniref:XdhC family protein n=1 Tax=Agrobacterium vitis TaxID=373 RepID=UPI0012E8F3CA|nr:XdhC family protein [Agrobacterium vitis]MVA60930.1 XdhC family protein [Agrobacterium vitis]